MCKINFFILLASLLLCDLFTYAYSHNEKHIVVVITSYNNAQWYKENLDSVFEQNYENYYLIYLDDCSVDGTADLVEQYIKSCQQDHRVILIRNERWASQMANHYRAVHMCDDEAIIIHLDGDDRLAHKHVLAYINDIYTSEDVWLTYGQAMDYPSGDISFAKQFPEGTVETNGFRDFPFIYSHLRTFYAWLFKQIKFKDLLINSNFESVGPAPDAAFMYPMVEMAGKHVRFVPEILYIKNVQNPLSQTHLNKKRQKNCDRLLRSRRRYEPLSENLSSPISQRKDNKLQALCVIFSNNKQQALLLENQIKKHVKDVDKIFIVEKENKEEFCAHRSRSSEYLPTFIENLEHATAEHVLLLTDACKIYDSFSLKSYIEMLEQTYAYAFYLGSSKKDVSHIRQKIDKDMYAWSFFDGLGIFRKFNNLDGTIYRKQIIIDFLKKFIQGSSLNTTEALSAWVYEFTDVDNIGLVGREQKIFFCSGSDLI